MQGTVAHIEGNNAVNNVVQSVVSDLVRSGSYVGRGVRLSGPARKQGLEWLSQEPCGIRKRLASHIEWHAMASVMIP